MIHPWYARWDAESRPSLSWFIRLSGAISRALPPESVLARRSGITAADKDIDDSEQTVQHLQKILDQLQEQTKSEVDPTKQKKKDILTIKRIEQQIREAIKEQNEREASLKETTEEKKCSAGENKEFFELQYVSPMIQEHFGN